MDRLAVIALTSLSALTACGDDAEPGPRGPVGPELARGWEPIVLQPGYYKAETLPMVPVSEGDPVTVRFASQGGYAMFVGARIRGLPPGTARVDTALVDPDDGVALVSDSRVIEVVACDDDSGDVEPDFQSSANFSHLVACPNYGSRPVHATEWILRIRISDPEREARAGKREVRVIPTCAPGSRYLNCLCTCDAGYSLGKCGAEH